MNSDQQDRLEQMDAATRADIQRKAERRLRYQRRKSGALWFGLGTMGIVGWSVAVPMLIGIALGLYLDERVPVGFSWTLTGLTVGVVLGCLNAWYWISRKQEEIQLHRTQEDRVQADHVQDDRIQDSSEQGREKGRETHG